MDALATELAAMVDDLERRGKLTGRARAEILALIDRHATSEPEYEYAYQADHYRDGHPCHFERSPWRWYSTGEFWSILDWGPSATARVAHTVRKVRRVKAGPWESVESVPMPAPR